MSVRDKKNSSAIQIIISLVMILFCLITFVPFILAIIVSISNEDSIIKNGFSFFPEKITLDAYKLALHDNMILSSYKVTITVTTLGTIAAVVLCAMLGYAMSVKKVKYRNAISFFMFIPMVFNAGLLPWYLICTRVLHIQNSIQALILPMLINPFNVFLLRNYFRTIPDSLAESAEIDGATPFVTFFKIILPLAKPILATVTLFIALAYWNDFTMALWFINKKILYPLQYILYKILSLISFINSGQISSIGSLVKPKESLQMAIFIITIGPIILLYPFVQKYFVKGIMIGSVKG